MKWLFYCGYRGQQALPVLALKPSVASTDKRLPENSQLRMSQRAEGIRRYWPNACVLGEFLVIGVPYHSEYLRGLTEIFEEVSGG